MYPDANSPAQCTIDTGLRLEPLCQQRAIEHHRVVQRAKQVAALFRMPRYHFAEIRDAVREFQTRKQAEARQHEPQLAEGFRRHVHNFWAKHAWALLTLHPHDTRHGPHNLVAFDGMAGTKILHVPVVHPRPCQFQQSEKELEVRPVWPEREEEAPVVLLHMHMVAHGNDGIPMLAVGLKEENRKMRLPCGVVGRNDVLGGWCIGHAQIYQQRNAVGIAAAGKERPNVNLFLAPL